MSDHVSDEMLIRFFTKHILSRYGESQTNVEVVDSDFCLVFEDCDGEIYVSRHPMKKVLRLFRIYYDRVKDVDYDAVDGAMLSVMLDIGLFEF